MKKASLIRLQNVVYSLLSEYKIVYCRYNTMRGGGGTLRARGRLVSKSPMPVDADMDAIDRMMNLLSDSDVGDNNIRQGLESEIILNFDTNSEDALNVSNIEENGTKNGEPYQLPESIEDNNNQLNENNTPIPSPECATNHLDYDCSNDFCPWYIENAIQEPHSVISSTTDLLSTPQANTPFSSFSESTPSCSRKRKNISRKDVGNIRRRHVADWIDNKRKKLRNLGKEYKSRDGTTRLAKSLKPMCLENCRQKCSSKISSDERIYIFNQFWNLGNREKQWAFVAYLVLKQKKRRVFTDTPSRRNFTLIYRLNVNRGGEDQFMTVCKKTFLNTFSISEQFVYTALEKLDTTSGLIEMDQRGRHDNHRKVITEDVIKSVCDHIKSIQPVESHYTRSRSDKRYLDGDLNFHRLFDLYKEWFDEQVYSSIANTERQYRDIVNEHFKLSFHVPKKDQCDKCHIYKNKFTPTLVETQLHESHLRNKNLALEPLYQSNLPIPKAKKDDLINMCNSEIIPSGYHNFFTNLPSVNVSDNDPDSDLD
ncbi:hypothetical protein HW555_004678 [Spodoptera exigua]|uniref:Uncharacterized protein n=1 Tax=Spodoptera exigua TaxID=7107 RepID=A0A835GIL9_SPOEX|nr:hypothetical protein HW555_004678 [Spodoptera exigua]